ncbi:MAG: ABC transporter permease, partial [Christensenella sp.]|uniref:ABC transporter permease n=1 Tax=Christensenella sp. TaxID=1935934 RepID=UPI002B1F42AA
IILVAAFIIAAIVAKYTVFGRDCYAIGGNEEAAVMKGIPVNKVKFFTYLLSGACAGLAGVIVAARTYSGNILLGDGYEMDVIAAVVLGGTLLSGGRGKVLNSMWGALIITIIGNIINLNQISYLWEGCITGGVLLVILVLQSRMTSKQHMITQN